MSGREAVIALAVEVGKALVQELLVPALRKWRDRGNRTWCQWRCGDCGLPCTGEAGHNGDHHDDRGHRWQG